MTQQQNYYADIAVSYLNARNGNRPPSIKDAGGNYYTISDAAYGSGMIQQGASGRITYYVTAKGYKVATAWNGQELPRDQRNGGGQPPAAPINGGPQPSAPSAPPAPQAQAGGTTGKDRLIIRGGIAKSCIEAGKTLQDAQAWWDWCVGRTQQQAAPPPPPPPPPPPSARAELDDEIPF